MSINVQSWLTQYMSEIDCLQNEKSRFILRCFKFYRKLLCNTIFKYTKAHLPNNSIL